MQRLYLAAGGALLLHGALFLGLAVMGEQGQRISRQRPLRVALALRTLPEEAHHQMPPVMKPAAPLSNKQAESKPVETVANSKAVTAPLPAPVMQAQASSSDSGSAAPLPPAATAAARENGDAVQQAVPLYRLNPPPAYPYVARKRRYEGLVLLAVLILPDGRVGESRLARSSGYTVLDEAARRAVRSWVFAPGSRGGVPVAMEVEVPVRFTLQ